MAMGQETHTACAKCKSKEWIVVSSVETSVVSSRNTAFDFSSVRHFDLSPVGLIYRNVR